MSSNKTLEHQLRQAQASELKDVDLRIAIERNDQPAIDRLLEKQANNSSDKQKRQIANAMIARLRDHF